MMDSTISEWWVRRLAALAMAGVLLAGGTGAGAADAASGLEFFENKIRPLLLDHCLKCHGRESGEKPKGGLALDSREGWLKGGEHGPAIVPGNPDKSLLIRAVRYTDKELQMPPKDKKLSAQQIADLETWVRFGAPDPRTGTLGGPPLSDPNKVRTHWAFQPLKEPALPRVKNSKWVQTPVDAFVLAQLEAKGWKPSPRADPRTLLRRVTHDLTGLPPTPAEVDSFLADTSPKAFERVVDRLLASPRHGERWARHWLDVARYADTKGYLAGDEQRRYAYSYTYRDYVIRAFNEDLPYDQFIQHQIAADLMPLGDDKRPLAALGFLTLGRRFLNNANDIIDDRIDVVTRGTMGLTVQCARCHDHKYDPIPTREYYGLYGVFASSHEPGEKPLLGIPPDEASHQAYLAEKKKRGEEMETYRQEQLRKAMGELRKRAGDYLLAAAEVSAKETQDSATASRRDRNRYFQERKLDPNVARRWQDYLATTAKQHDPVWAPWHAVAALGEKEFAAKAAELSVKVAANQAAGRPLNPRVAKLFAGAPPASIKEVAERYGKLLNESDSDDPSPDADREALRLVLRAGTAPTNVPAPENDSLLEAVRPRLRQLKAKIDEVDAVHPGAPPRAMALADNAAPMQPVVFVRGNPGNRGPEVPRAFVGIASARKPEPFKHGSGRLELAQAITRADNPLTSRVLVNRVWGWHFGQGLVRTPSDFGVRSDPPSHPALLDWLATKFTAHGWSLKKLHRLIVLSATYQQSSNDRPEQLQADPANLLLWKFNRQRLGFEALRDTLLASSGKLDPTPGSQPVDLLAQPFTSKRTVFGYIDRQNLPGVFRTFDFASPDVSAAQRYHTTVPQQALFLMNSPFVLQQAQGVIAREEFQKLPADAERIRFLFRLLYQRAPTPDELGLARSFLAAPIDAGSAAIPSAGWHYGFGEFDLTAQRVSSFTAFKFFTGGQWQMGRDFPDPRQGHVMLRAEGGHTGSDQAHAAIRRWVAPRDGTVNITAALAHGAAQGDGVRGRLVSGRTGLLGEWIARNNSAETKFSKLEVKAGETLDFVVDLRASQEHDTFQWSPVIKYDGVSARASKLPPGLESEWNAMADFGKSREAAPALGKWEQLAHALLLSNELSFVD